MGAEWLLAYRDAVMCGPSPLSIAERELIAAYVSGLNSCNYCYTAHSVFAKSLGIEPDVFPLLVENPQAAGIDERLLPILLLLRDLTLTPHSVRSAHGEIASQVGLSPQAISDAVTVCAFFNCANRIAEGCGLEKDLPRPGGTIRARIERRSRDAPHSSVRHDYHSALMRGPGPLDLSDREMLAAYVSAMNGCAGSAILHRDAALEHGASLEYSQSVLAKGATTTIESSKRPLFALASILTRAPSEIARRDMDDAIESGWSEAAVFQVIAITGWINHNNRLLPTTSVSEAPTNCQ